MSPCLRAPMSPRTCRSGRAQGPRPAIALLARLQQAQQVAHAARLHDHVLQNLYSLQLASAEMRGDALRAQLSRIAVDVQALVRELAPPGLGAYGLVEALRSQRQAEEKLCLHLSVQGVAERPHPADLSLFRIVQEALANVARHAGVREATVRLTQQGEALTLQVEDAGCGFAGGATYRRWQAEGRYGLTRARLYARAIGGRLSLQAAPGAGTLLTVQVPTFRPAPLR